MPDAISGASTPRAAAATEAPTVDPSLLNQPTGFDQDMFLQLLVAQLKYQNPMEPMDSSQFMAQTAQFTTVEKLEELTSQIAESLSNDRMGTATGLIGRNVTFVRADGNTATAEVSSVRFEATGPKLILSDRSEIGMGEIQQVSSRT